MTETTSSHLVPTSSGRSGPDLVPDPPVGGPGGDEVEAHFQARPRPVVGVDPGGRQTGVVARAGTRPVWACTVTREGLEMTPAAAYVAEVVAAVADALALLAEDGPVLLAVEGVVEPSGHVRMLNVAGLLGTAIVLGAILGAYPAAVVVPPGGHGSGPLESYPASLRGVRELKGRGRFRHVRSAYDVAGAGVFLTQLDQPERTHP